MRPFSDMLRTLFAGLSRQQRRALPSLLAAGCALLLAGCASTRPPPGVTAVTPFDLQRYQGH